MKRVFWYALALTATLGAPTTRAGVIYSDFGPSFSYAMCCEAFAISGSAAPSGYFAAANMFSASAGGIVSQIDVALILNGTGPGSATVSLWTDVGNSPGVQLGSWGVTATQGCCSVSAIVTVPVVSGPSLTSGQSYFMVLFPGGSTSDDGWMWNNQGVSALDLYSQDGGTTWNSNGSETLGAFDVLSTPEPATTLLLAIGLLCILVRGHRFASWPIAKP